jgi:aminoglycoside phosphotransferase (APT) family kinase protein
MAEQTALSHAGMALPESLESFVQERYPFSAGTVAVTPYKEGHHNQIFLGTGGQLDLPDTFLLRHPKCSEAAAALEASYATRSRLPESFRTPRALDLGRLSCCGMPVMLEEFVEGEHKAFDSLSTEEIRTLAQAVAGIHGNRSDRFSGASGQEPTRNGSYADYLRAMVRESVIERMKTVPSGQYGEARQAIRLGRMQLNGMLVSQAELFGGRAFSLLHHDLNPDNILWRPDGVVFIDCNPTWGDPADDVDYICTNNQVGPDFEWQFREEYAAATGSDEALKRTAAYALKNRLDDMAWSITMLEDNQTAEYEAIYRQRLQLLQAMVG